MVIITLFFRNFARYYELRYKQQNNMLTLRLITEETERVIKGLEKKQFAGAREAIESAIEIDKKRRQAQTLLDQNLSEAKKLAAEIGGLMKQGRRDEAEQVKARVATLKQQGQELEQQKAQAEHEIGRAHV